MTEKLIKGWTYYGVLCEELLSTEPEMRSKMQHQPRIKPMQLQYALIYFKSAHYILSVISQVCYLRHLWMSRVFSGVLVTCSVTCKVMEYFGELFMKSERFVTINDAFIIYVLYIWIAIHIKIIRCSRNSNELDSEFIKKSYIPVDDGDTEIVITITSLQSVNKTNYF